MMTTTTVIIISKTRIGVGTSFEPEHSLTDTAEPVSWGGLDVGVVFVCDGAVADNVELGDVEFDIIELNGVKLACVELDGA